MSSCNRNFLPPLVAVVAWRELPMKEVGQIFEEVSEKVHLYQEFLDQGSLAKALALFLFVQRVWMSALEVVDNLEFLEELVTQFLLRNCL